MDISRDCEILIGRHLQQNARPNATQKDIDNAYPLFREKVIAVLEEFELEIEALKAFRFPNKLVFSLKDTKKRYIYLSSKEVQLIQELVNRIFNANICLQEFNGKRPLMNSPLHSGIFSSEPRGSVSVSGIIDIKSIHSRL